MFIIDQGYDRCSKIGKTHFYLYEWLHILTAKRGCWNYENEIYSSLNESGNWNSSLSLVQQIDTQGIHHLGMFNEGNEIIEEENRCLSFKFIED